MKTMNNEDKLAEGLVNEAKTAMLEWMGQKWTDVYTMGRLNAILDSSKSLDFSKKELVITISFSELMKEMKNFHEKAEETEEEED